MNDAVCSVCGVIRNTDGDFTFSTGAKGSPDKVYSRVCKYALERNKVGCINNKGEYDEKLSWLVLTE